MAFAKIDTAILTSSLWVNREIRDVFLTALLMAVPRDIAEPMEQIEIGGLNHTGFVIPPGCYGWIPAASTGLIHRALVSQEEGEAALIALGNPDKESRSQEFEGRRLVRVNGGFIVLNFMKYRNVDTTNADRQRRFRERQQKPNGASQSRRRGKGWVSRSRILEGMYFPPTS